jgi:thiol:disulfide interchange protein DsbC
MRSLTLALLSSLSLAACAQSTTPGGVPIAVTPAAKPAPAGKPVASAPAGSPEAKVRDALRSLNDKIEIDAVDAAPFPGFRQVIAAGQVVYVSDDGKYLMQGGLLDIAKRQDLSEAAMAKVRGKVLATLPVADRIVFAPQGTPKHRIVVLTDIECGYCRKFHTEMAQNLGNGIQVEYLAFPRAGLGTPDYKKMVSVWCAADRQKAITDAKNDRPVPNRTCKTPVDMQYRAGQRMGLTGTPMILTEDGRMLGGYLPPEALKQRLEQLAKEDAANAKGA